jgi:hypothetical protein
LKEKVLNDEGRKQQSKLRELSILATTFDCTLAQLAIGKDREYEIQITNTFSSSVVFKK